MAYTKDMTFNNSQFSVRWKDKEGVEREKTYSDYAQARKAHKWLNDNGAVADIAVIKHIEVSEEGGDASMFPVKEVK